MAEDVIETEDQAGIERKALADLLQSEGWQLFTRLAREDWGAEAVLQKIDSAMATIARGDTAAVTDTVQQIQACRGAVEALLRRPAERMQQLRPRQAASDWLGRHKRVTR